MINYKEEFKRLSKGKKLLLVEDDPKTIEVLKNFLGSYFTLIKTATNGNEAWSAYRKEKFDLVISDIEMPELNGVMLSKGIRARNPEQAILITSAYTNEKYLVELINIGIDGFLKKPVNMQNLYETIVRALKLVQSRDEVYRIKFQAMTKAITKKDRPITKSHHQKKLEDTVLNDVKISVKEFMQDMKQNDHASYEFFQKQKELLMDTLYELVENYEVFAYKNYDNTELFKAIVNDINTLYHTLEYFDKVKQTSTQIGRLFSILEDIDIDELNEDLKHSVFDILEFLINDIKQYIMDMFFNENIENSNYFHDSLKENISTFEDTLNKNVENSDCDIEFL